MHTIKIFPSAQIENRDPAFGKDRHYLLHKIKLFFLLHLLLPIVASQKNFFPGKNDVKTQRKFSAEKSTSYFIHKLTKWQKKLAKSQCTMVRIIKDRTQFLLYVNFWRWRNWDKIDEILTQKQYTTVKSDANVAQYWQKAEKTKIKLL